MPTTATQNPATHTLPLPGSVWYDALDPMACGMQAGLGLPEPQVQPSGKGQRFTYVGVPTAVAEELADYLWDRASTLGSQGHLESAERSLYNRMAKAALRIRKVLKDAPVGATAATAAAPAPAPAKPQPSPHDFSLNGVRFHHARQLDQHWLVDVTNGDTTYTLHNRHGSWAHDVNGSGTMWEPVRVARALGTQVSQLEMCQALAARVAKEQPKPTKPATVAAETNTTNTKEEATMARKPRSTATATKAEETTTKATAASNGRTKAPAFTLTKKDATAIAKELRDKSATMVEIRTRYGHSDGSKVRAALRAHGYGSKGQANPDGLTPTEWRAQHGAEDGASKPAAKAAKAKAEPEPEEDDEPEADGEETADERRLRLRRERRQAKKAEASKPKRRPRSKAAADPS